MDRIAANILSLQRVESRNECRVAPGQVEAEMLMCDVDCPNIPVFVVEEVKDVDEVEEVEK